MKTENRERNNQKNVNRTEYERYRFNNVRTVNGEQYAVSQQTIER